MLREQTACRPLKSQPVKTGLWLLAMCLVLTSLLGPANADIADSQNLTAASSASRADDPQDQPTHERHLNWLSCNHEKTNTPPLLAVMFNFTLLIALLIVVTRGPLRTFLTERHEQIRSDIEHATRLRQGAQDQLARIEAKLRELDTEIAKIQAAVARDAEAEKQRIIEAAQQEAQRLITLADKTLQREIDRVKRTLEVNAIEAAIEAAEKLLVQEVTDTDRERIHEEYLTQIASTGGGQ